MMQHLMQYHRPYHGLYKLESGWGNFRIIQSLQNGCKKKYFSYTIPAVRSREHLIKSVALETEISETGLRAALNDTSFLKTLDLDPENVYCIFLPGTYRKFSSGDPFEVLRDIREEFLFFWNHERVQLANKISLKPVEVSKLASIVYAETKNVAEMPVVAGLYLNRLKKNMRLEADPTLLFAKNNIRARRVYFKYKTIDSPYNTYKYKGLPPGPIGPAPPFVIEAVLHAEEHDFLYFCARGDSSGCHNFTQDFEEHKLNAQKYRGLLDKRKIR